MDSGMLSTEAASEAKERRKLQVPYDQASMKTLIDNKPTLQSEINKCINPNHTLDTASMKGDLINELERSGAITTQDAANAHQNLL